MRAHSPGPRGIQGAVEQVQASQTGVGYNNVLPWSRPWPVFRARHGSRIVGMSVTLRVTLRLTLRLTLKITAGKSKTRKI